MAMNPEPSSRVSEAVALPVPIEHSHSHFDASFPPINSPIGIGPSVMIDQDAPIPWYLDVSGVWQRHRSAMIQTIILSAIAGLVVGSLFSTRLWLIEGRMRFISPPNVDGREVFKPMSLLTYCDLVLSDENLERLAKEFRDRLPPASATKYLKSQIKADAPRNTEIIEVSMDTPDPELGVALIGRLMQLHIDYTNELRRTTTLQQSRGLLRSTIERCDSQIRKWNTTVEEYQARLRSGAPLESLDLVELDSTFAHRRRSLLEDVNTEQARLSELEFALSQKQGEYNRQLDLHRRNVGVPFELENAREAMKGAENSVKISRNTISRKQDECRNLPLEFANIRILEQTVLMREAQRDLKLLSEKMNSFGALSPAGATADLADENWTRLRQRLLGADAPEFDVLKAATVPAYPSSSNRKMLTATCFAAPILLVFLTLAFLDHWRKPPTTETHLAVIEKHARPMPSSESALLTMRIQQWLIEPPSQIVDDAMNIEDTPVSGCSVSPKSHSVNGDRASS